MKNFKPLMMTILISTLLIAVLVGGFSFLTAEDNKEKEAVATPNFKVTFIELGSVRCIPCKKMVPIMDDIKKEYAGQVQVLFYDVWTDEGKPYGAKYKIRLIPTQIFLDKDGKEYFRHEGFFAKEQLVEILKQQGVK